MLVSVRRDFFFSNDEYLDGKYERRLVAIQQREHFMKAVRSTRFFRLDLYAVDDKASDGLFRRRCRLSVED